jgi:hypothetical protein
VRLKQPHEVINSTLRNQRIDLLCVECLAFCASACWLPPHPTSSAVRRDGGASTLVPCGAAGCHTSKRAASEGRGGAYGGWEWDQPWCEERGQEWLRLMRRDRLRELWGVRELRDRCRRRRLLVLQLLLVFRRWRLWHQRLWRLLQQRWLELRLQLECELLCWRLSWRQ